MLLNVIIFSKDRAMQLDLLLQSILLNFNVEDYKFKNLQKDTPSTQYKFEIEGQTRESARRNLDNYLYFSY